MNQNIYKTYCQILKEELVPAMGCTEPIALAYCASKCKDLIDDNIKEILKISRTLGGHLVWPRGNNKSVNTLKGGKLKAGCNYGFYDRIDWVLLLLKIFYLTIHKDRHDYIQQIKKHFKIYL